MKQLRRQDAPPPGPSGPYVRRVEPNQSPIFIIISPCLWGCYVHWDPAGRRSLPCFESKVNCVGHRLQIPAKWLGYLHVYNHNTKQQEFLELPAGAARKLMALCNDGQDLRGRRIQCARGNGKKSRIQVTLLAHINQVKPDTKLPAAKDPEETLRILWGINEIFLKLAGTDELPMNEAM